MKFKPLTTIDELKAAQDAGLRVERRGMNFSATWVEVDYATAAYWLEANKGQLRVEVRDEPGYSLFTYSRWYGGGVRSALRHVVDCVLAELPAQRYPDEAVKALVEAATDLLKVCDALLQADLVPPMAHTRTALANLEPKS